MSEKYFNSTKQSRNLLPILSYIGVKDLFYRKFLTELILNVDSVNDSCTFYLALKQGHLNNKKFKQDFIELNKILIDSIEIDAVRKKGLLDRLIINTDNASKALSMVIEFCPMTTTVTYLSEVLSTEEQLTVHHRKKITDNFYLPASSVVYADDKYSLYSLNAKRNILAAIEKYKNIEVQEPTAIVGYFIERPKYNYDAYSLLKTESLNFLNELTGFSQRPDIISNLSDDYIYVMKDNKGFYIQLSKYISNN